MKKLLLLFIIIYSGPTIAQSLNPDVIATSGTSFNDGTSQLDWTLGETVTSTLTSGSNMLTQGFHQPNLLVTSINDPATDYSVTVFPNPTVDHVQLQFKNLKNMVTAEILSSDGKLLQSQNINAAGETIFDMSGYASGTYLLSVKDNSKIKTYKIIKLN
ncbi:MAG: T9SS type A sorting domain-containing protein [Bacteroidia bacterium]